MGRRSEITQVTADMKEAVWAIYNHRSGDHSKCPDWCPATKSGDVEKADKNILQPFVMKKLLPVFEELSSDSLREKCKHGGTQNANEAFHHLIWQRCPMVGFVGRKRLEIAVANATIVYNDSEQAREKLYEHLGLKPGPCTK